jgi:hypothetical protein
MTNGRNGWYKIEQGNVANNIQLEGESNKTGVRLAGNKI